MSTKLYDGFLLKPDTNLFEFKRRFKNVCLEKALYDLHVLRLVDIVELFDRIFVHQDVVKVPRISDKTEDLNSSVDVDTVLKELASYHSWLILSDQRAKIHANETAPDDLTGFLDHFNRWCETEIVVGQHSSGKLLSYPFNFNQELTELLVQDEAYERDFGYWNNSDKPKNVTDEEWEERYLLWEETFPKYSLSYYGIVLKFIEASDIEMSFFGTGKDFWDEKEVPDNVFDIYRRATKIVNRRWVEREIKKVEQEEGKAAVINEIMSIISSFDKHDPAVVEEIIEVQETLVPLSLDIIFGDK